jgi:nucleoside-diphosphate kinase
MQKTLVIIKPDAVQRRLIGKIISRFEEKGLEIIGLKTTVISEELARKNYSVHEGRDFFEKLIQYITAGPVVIMVLRGKNAIGVTRMLMGSTFGYEAAPGTIRGDYAISKRFNLLHGSDSVESAKREIAIFFKDNDIMEYGQSSLKWIYDISGNTPNENFI